MPAVSVLMPAYNVALYVGDAIRSVLNQTFGDFELVVVDDGSQDETAAIVCDLAARDPRIRLIRQANRGLAGARNTALRESTAPLLALLDSDDLWEPTFLAEHLALLAAHPEIDISTGNGWQLGGAEDGKHARPYPDPRPMPTLATIIGDERSVFIMSVFRRSVFERIGGFDETLRTNEDYDFWLRAAIAGCRFARLDTPLGHYRVRTDSLSANDLRMLRGILHVYTKLRPAIAGLPREMEILERQVVRFETEWVAAEARLALEIADFEAARAHLSALHARRGGATLALVRLLVRWTPKMFARVYGMRRGRAATLPTAPLR